MSLRVADYCETFDSLERAKEDGTLTPPVEDLLCDKLDELWNELTVDEVREVEARYPALRIRRLA
jgi:hypothetical protein